MAHEAWAEKVHHSMAMSQLNITQAEQQIAHYQKEIELERKVMQRYGSMLKLAGLTLVEWEKLNGIKQAG